MKHSFADNVRVLSAAQQHGLRGGVANDGHPEHDRDPEANQFRRGNTVPAGGGPD